MSLIRYLYFKKIDLPFVGWTDQIIDTGDIYSIGELKNWIPPLNITDKLWEETQILRVWMCAGIQWNKFPSKIYTIHYQTSLLWRNLTCKILALFFALVGSQISYDGTL